MWARNRLTPDGEQAHKCDIALYRRYEKKKFMQDIYMYLGFIIFGLQKFCQNYPKKKVKIHEFIKIFFTVGRNLSFIIGG